MLEQTRKFIEKETLFNKDDLLLVAVSGGVDSMVLLDILAKLGFVLEVCHVNYGLREKASDKDAYLVEYYCQQKGFTFHGHKIASEEMNELQKGNLQEKARELRYDLFGKIMVERKCQYTCLAHHQDDVAETFLIHSLRGSGSKGLRSIQSRSGPFRRPLLWCAKREITDYAQRFEIPFREDITNRQDNYDRNFVRNTIIPVIDDRFDNASKRLASSASLISDEYKLLCFLAENEKSRWWREQNEVVEIRNFDAFRKIPGAKSLLWIWLNPMGFTSATISQLLEARQTGSQYYSISHVALYDRNQLFVKKIDRPAHANLIIEGLGTYCFETGNCLHLRETNGTSKEKNPNIEIVDAEGLEFPLIIRGWQKGDIFQPLGMKGKHKKLSNFFSDEKISVFEKQDIRLLCDKTKILWVIGYRLAHMPRVKTSTRKYIQLQWEPGNKEEISSS